MEKIICFIPPCLVITFLLVYRVLLSTWDRQLAHSGVPVLRSLLQSKYLSVLSSSLSNFFPIVNQESIMNSLLQFFSPKHYLLYMLFTPTYGLLLSLILHSNIILFSIDIFSCYTQSGRAKKQGKRWRSNSKERSPRQTKKFLLLRTCHQKESLNRMN